MGRWERIISSSATAAALLVAQIASPARQPATAKPVQIFPSEPVWSVNVSARPIAAPVAAGGRLFVALQSGVSAWNVADIGKADAKEAWTAKIVPAGAIAASADRVIVPSDGTVHVLDAATGETSWTLKSGPLTAPPLVHGDWLYLAAGEHLSSYKLDNGSPGWTRELGVVQERPAISGDRIYVPGKDGRLMALALTTGEPVWETSSIGINPTEPVVAGDRVFIGSGTKIFCSFTTARGIKDWCQEIGAAVFGVAAVDDTRVYVVALDNLLWVFERRNGARKWKKDLRYRPSSGPLLVGTTVAAPGITNKLIAFDAASGNPGPQLAFDAELAQAAVLIPAEEGRPARLAAIVGGLQDSWKLTVSGPPAPPMPTLKIQPLSELPGLVVPLPGERAPRR